MTTTNNNNLAIRAFTGLNPNKLKTVSVERMPPVVSGHALKVRANKQGQCYKNAALFVLAWPKDNIRYCLGAADLGIYGGHAWIEIDGHHYDPTLELSSGKLAPDYCQAVTYTKEELWDWFCDELNEKLPPCITDIPEFYFDNAFMDNPVVFLNRLKEAAENGSDSI